MVNLNPSHHSDDIDPLNASMEDVVAFFIDREKRRKRDFPDDDSQKETTIGIKPVPGGLVALLDYVAYDSGVSRALITRCLSHRIAAWYESLDSIRDILPIYRDVQLHALDGGLPDILDRIRAVTYRSSVSCYGASSFRTIAWVQARLSDLVGPLGVPIQYLFSIGLFESLVSTDSGRYKGTLDVFRRELENFTTYLGQRLIDVGSARKLIDYRVLRSLGVHDITGYNDNDIAPRG